jgi:hypothetical protein
VDTLVDLVQDVGQELDQDRGIPVDPIRVNSGQQSTETLSAAGQIEFGQPRQGGELQVGVVPDALEERPTAFLKGQSQPPPNQ